MGVANPFCGDGMWITLDTGLPRPLYAQIRDQIRQRIMSGALNPGDRLEPSRELARQLGVHRTTVGNAYAELEAEGLIAGTVGRGTFVSPLAETVRRARREGAQERSDSFWDSLLDREPQDDSLGRLVSSVYEPGVISFAIAHGSDELISVDRVRRAIDAVLRREGPALLRYGSSGGYRPLRHYIEGCMRRAGISVEAEQILITSGCQQSLDLLRRSLVASGDVVVSENPTYPGLWNAFQSSGARLIGVPVGEDGLDLDHLLAVLERTRVKLILVSPTFQNPTGRTMSIEARRRLLEIARRFRVPIVEEDIYGWLRYRGREMPPLKALDTLGLVIYVNSFSKVGFPGLRVGWIVASRRVIERLRWAKQHADLHTNVLGQAALDELGRRGWLDRLLRRTRRLYEHKLDALCDALRRHFPPEARWTDPQGGMSVWVELPPGTDAGDLLVKARDRGVIFAPGRYFYFQDVRHHAFRLCYSSLTDDQIERGVGVLGSLLKEEMGKTGKSSTGAAELALV